tara:strand:+ start:387 stop:581 length:195 start_codon:yes stop_codon:yes gene_type:complete
MICIKGSDYVSKNCGQYRGMHQSTTEANPDSSDASETAVKQGPNGGRAHRGSRREVMELTSPAR